MIKEKNNIINVSHNDSTAELRKISNFAHARTANVRFAHHLTGTDGGMGASVQESGVLGHFVPGQFAPRLFLPGYFVPRTFPP
jgi:hypothetical protein